MKTIIYYYTGTGNSLWTARQLAQELGNAEIHPMTKMIKDGGTPKADAAGIVFPVHMWGVPGLVIQFLKTIQKDSAKYYFAFAVNAGQVSRTLIQLRNLMKSRGLPLSAGFDIVLPSNYIPWGGPGPAEHLQKLYNEAGKKIEAAAKYIAGKETGHIEKGSLWQRIVFTALYKMTYNMIPKMDRNFRVDDKCNGCGTCADVCPVGNILLDSKKPAWQHRCEQCLACIQWCPQEAIQYGKKTPAYERYHHPEIKLKDMMFKAK
ncbi:MAG: EFR1 family ferrodoxin [Spirochaetes bacterium]|nr:EFR1 family ferrodoxin [Spirochaetota bacterium]